jgi:hydrogenase maturation protein HypF
MARRLRIQVTGLVQGVGFRPFVFRLAERFGLSGWVLNSGCGVTIEVQGEALHSFCSSLRGEAPPLAAIEQIDSQQITCKAETGFTIKASQPSKVTTSITPDGAVCEACLEELFDPQSRYYRYPFINCTHCGPRYTITRSLPYDRAQTSMASFAMCGVCAEDYHDPKHRRFHAQPTACPLCGPQLSMPLDEIVQHLGRGEILAIKGLGGYNLVCDATNEQAVQQLRRRKGREQKPFAVMVANLSSVDQLAECDELAAKLLQSPARPIVLLPKRDGGALADSIAPGIASVGLMLPNTPLHYLLFHQAAGSPAGSDWLAEPQDLKLVMTSANPGGEPLVIDDDEAGRRLSGIADKIISHNRPILIRADDSVMRVVNGAPQFIRRARGFVPRPIKLPHEIPATLALGGHLKNTLCITRGDEAFLSQHIGDMDNPQTIHFFEESLQHLLNILQVKPEQVAHDLHPNFYTSHFAEKLGLPSIGVQHHHAHLAAVAAEHHIQEPAIGLALDGFGLGEREESWGGECLLINGADYQRLGYLTPLKQPGGEVAAQQPWRMAAALLDRLGRGEEIAERFSDQRGAALLHQLLAKDINSPPTSSCGRLFDAASALLGVAAISSFEGQAAMQLEGLVSQPQVLADGWRVEQGGELNLLPLMAALAECSDAQQGANLFHGTLIAALADWAIQMAKEHEIKIVLLSGGCLLNRVLAEGLIERLIQSGLRPLMPQQAPPNDGGLSLGQAWVAGQMKGLPVA